MSNRLFTDDTGKEIASANGRTADALETIAIALSGGEGTIRSYKMLLNLIRGGLISRWLHVGEQIVVNKESGLSVTVTGGITAATVDEDVFMAATGHAGTAAYEFAYDGAAWILNGEYHNPELTYKLTGELLRRADRPTCVFMPDDYSAMGGLNAAKDLGLSVPEDVSFVGYDGIAYSQLLSPKLTTYLQDTAKIGATAAKELVALIESPQTTFKEVITVDGKLIVGGSVSKVG